MTDHVLNVQDSSQTSDTIDLNAPGLLVVDSAGATDRGLTTYPTLFVSDSAGLSDHAVPNEATDYPVPAATRQLIPWSCRIVTEFYQSDGTTLDSTPADFEVSALNFEIPSTDALSFPDAGYLFVSFPRPVSFEGYLIDVSGCAGAEFQVTTDASPTMASTWLTVDAEWTPIPVGGAQYRSPRLLPSPISNVTAVRWHRDTNGSDGVLLNLHLYLTDSTKPLQIWSVGANQHIEPDGLATGIIAGNSSQDFVFRVHNSGATVIQNISVWCYGSTWDLNHDLDQEFWASNNGIDFYQVTATTLAIEPLGPGQTSDPFYIRRISYNSHISYPYAFVVEVFDDDDNLVDDAAYGYFSDMDLTASQPHLWACTTQAVEQGGLVEFVGLGMGLAEPDFNGKVYLQRGADPARLLTVDSWSYVAPVGTPEVIEPLSGRIDAGHVVIRAFVPADVKGPVLVRIFCDAEV